MGAAMNRINRSGMNRNAALILAHGLFLNMLFVLPVLVLYYRDALGLGFREFMIGEAVFATTMILMEVPSGWLSDVWTRRKTMILGTLFHIVGFTILWQADSFAMTILSQAVIGVAVSLFSGTNSALLYDSLLEDGRAESFRRLEGLRHGIGLYSVAGASIAGGLLYQWHRDAPIVLVIASSCIALAISFCLREPERQRESVHKHPLADMAATVRYALRGHAAVGAIILLSSFLFATTKMLMWAQQPYYAALSLPESLYGVFIACGFALGGLGAHLGHVLDGRVTHGRVLVLCILHVLFVCVAAGLWTGYHGVALLMSGSLIWGFAAPHVQHALNEQVGSARRATILSTANLMISVVAIPLYVLMGFMADTAGVGAGLLALAVLMGLVLLLAGGMNRLKAGRTAPLRFDS